MASGGRGSSISIPEPHPIDQREEVAVASGEEVEVAVCGSEGRVCGSSWLRWPSASLFFSAECMKYRF